MAGERSIPCKLLVLALLLGGAAWFGRFAWLRITLRPTPRPEYWEAKLAELDPPPPGAISAGEAFKILTSRPFESNPALSAPGAQDLLDTLPWSGPWDEQRPDVVAATAVFTSEAFREARAKLRVALAAGWRDTVRLDPSAPIGLFHEYRQWAKWLAAHSRWAARQPDPGGTIVEDWIAMLQLGRQLRRQQTLLGFLIAALVEGLAAEQMATGRDLPCGLDVHRLGQAADALFGPKAVPADLLPMLQIDRQCVSDYLYIRDGGDWLNVSAAAKWDKGGRPSPFWNLASPLFHDFATAQRSVDRFFDSCRGLVNLVLCEAAQCEDPTPEFPYQVRLAGALASGAPTLLDGWRSPGDVPRSLSLHYRYRCSLDAALAMLALEQYRCQRGRYPDALAELVPEFLPRLPVDYADLQPLRYRRDGERYVLYSIGIDGRDDGGISEGAYIWVYEDNQPDVVYSKWGREAKP